MTIKGNLKDMNLSSIVTLNCNEGNQACLRITSGEKEAVVFFETGQIAHAALDSEEGEDVIYELLTWDEGTFEIEQNVSPPKRTITTNWSGLILEGMRRIDERAANEDGLDNMTIKAKEEYKMNVKKLNEAIEVLKENLGGALLATDIWSTADGQSLAGFNPQPKAAALFNQVTDNMLKALKGAGFPTLGKYYIMDLVDGNMAILLPLDEYQWGMLLDSMKAPLGLLLNVVIPQIIDKFEEAIAS